MKILSEPFKKLRKCKKVVLYCYCFGYRREMELLVADGITDLQRHILENRIIHKITLRQLLVENPDFKFEYKISDLIFSTENGYE
jgi:hypothetical protein